MIIIATAGSTFGGITDYAMNKKGAEVLTANGVRCNDSKLVTKDFKLIANENTRVKKPMSHFVISFSKEDKPTNEHLIEIAEKFLDGLKYNNNQYVVVKHNDAQHCHLHIVANRVSLDNKVVSKEFLKRKIQNLRRDLEKQYPCYKSANGKNLSETNLTKLVGYDKTRYYIYTAIKKELPNVTSIAQLVKTLEIKYAIKSNIKYKRGSTTEVQGISFENNNGIKVKGSDVDKNFSYSKLLQHFNQRNSGTIKRTENEKPITTAVNITPVIAGLTNDYTNAIKKPKHNWVNDNEMER